MDDPITISLAVTGIGMLMLFLALALLYGLMVLMTRMTATRGRIIERPEARSGEQGDRGAREQGSMGAEVRRVMRRRAAVIGVALARSEQRSSAVNAPGAGEAAISWHASCSRISPWRALHHQRQLTPSLPTRRGR
jgi:Na+-transporting methylmalonyl-CoA/oxaloacetate decarboxylase gamma subunit